MVSVVDGCVVVGSAWELSSFAGAPREADAFAAPPRVRLGGIVKWQKATLHRHVALI